MRWFLLICLLFATSIVMAEDMSSILVVIDMQKKFTTSKSSVAHIKKLIKEFKSNERPVLFLKYDEKSGDVYEELMDEVKGYSHYFEVEKNGDDGSEEIMNTIQQKNINPNTITIVGLNTCCCVAETVIGLNNKISSDSKTQIVVDPQGCHCHGHYDFIDYFTKGDKTNYSCIWKEEKFDELSKLAHVKVKSCEEAPKRKLTKFKCRKKKAI